MKCSGDFEILHGIFGDTTRISSSFSDFLVVPRTISCSISKSQLHFISFLTVHWLENKDNMLWCTLYSVQQYTVYSVYTLSTENGEYFVSLSEQVSRPLVDRSTHVVYSFAM